MANDDNNRFYQSYSYKQYLFVKHGVNHDILQFGKPESMATHLAFALCERGMAKIQINETVRELTPGSHVIITPSSYICLLEASEDYDMSFVAINPSFRKGEHYSQSIPLIDAMLFIKEQPVIQLDKQQQDFYTKIRDLMEHTIQNTPDSYKEMLLLELSYAFMIWEETTIAKNINSSPVNKTPKDIMAAKFLSLVTANFRKEHKLDFYANKMCITPKYLSITLRKVTGQTASKWIDAFIVNEAQKLLLSTSKNIAEISDDLGFPNQSFFGKYFKKHVGKNPLSYRFKKRLRVADFMAEN